MVVARTCLHQPQSIDIILQPGLAGRSRFAPASRMASGSIAVVGAYRLDCFELPLGGVE